MKKVLNFVLVLLICFIFIDIVGAETYENFNSSAAPVSCGNNLVTKIPAMIPSIISILYNIIQVAVPIVLVVIGSLDLMKGITASKEDEIKKGQQLFVKRLISAALIFFVFIIVKFIISMVAGDNKNDNKAMRIMQCAECFINNNCD